MKTLRILIAEMTDQSSLPRRKLNCRLIPGQGTQWHLKGKRYERIMFSNKNYHLKTHGDIVNSNIRPQSACMMNKIDSRSNIIDTRLKENGINFNLQRNIIEKRPVHKKKIKNVDRTRFGYKPQRNYSRRNENKAKQTNLSTAYSRKQRYVSGASNF